MLMKELMLLGDGSTPEVIDKASKTGIKVVALSEDVATNIRELISPDLVVDVKEWPEYSQEGLTLVRIRRPEDLKVVEEVAARSKVLIDSEGWKIIPLENIIAELGGDKIYAIANSVEEARSLLGVLEVGVKGVVMPIDSISKLNSVIRLFEEVNPLELVEVEVLEVREVGLGDRVCIDTTSILEPGEGMLVGGSASFFLLVHSENIKSPFTSPREFRVNAGAVSNYVLVPGGKTKYLSEVKSGLGVLAVNKDGRRRIVSVGRAKVERRPMVLIRAKANAAEGWAVLQLAETVPLTRADGSPLPVTEVKPGDKILVYVEEKKARHFGTAVDEFIEER